MSNKEFPKIDGYTADIGIIRFKMNQLQILLIKRSELTQEGEPNIFGGYYALPGGFVNFLVEDGLEGAKRELFEETGISAKHTHLRHVTILDKPNRDPRGNILSNLFYAVVPPHTEAIAGDDAAEAKWFNIDRLPELLAFDHKEAIDKLLDNVKKDIIESYRGNPFFDNQINVITTLIGECFTLVQLYQLIIASGIKNLTMNGLFKYLQRSPLFLKIEVTSSNVKGPRTVKGYTYKTV